MHPGCSERLKRNLLRNIAGDVLEAELDESLGYA
jgi:hypothetical protein